MTHDILKLCDEIEAMLKHETVIGDLDDDSEVLFALQMALEHDQRHQSMALRTWMPRISKWSDFYIKLRNAAQPLIDAARESVNLRAELDTMRKFEDDVERITAMWLDMDDCGDASMTTTQRVLNSVKHMRAELDKVRQERDDAYERAAQAVVANSSIATNRALIRALKDKP